MKTELPIADAEESTRRRVAAQILQHGPSTTAQLAERLGLTQAAVRRHLGALEASGQLEAREAHGDRGRGRPAKLYALTPAGRAQFPQAYDALALQALDFLAESGGDDAIRAFAADRARRVEDRYRALRAADPELDATEALTQALDAEGYVAQAQPAGSGAQLCQHHCPVAHVAQRYPQLCEAETAVFAKLVGSDVQRLATIAHGDNVCTTHIPNRGDA